MKNEEILNLLKELAERIKTMINKISKMFNDSECFLKDLIKFRIKNDQGEAKQLPFVRYSDEIAVCLYIYMNEILFSNNNSEQNIIFLLDDKNEAEICEAFASIQFMLPEPKFPNIFVDNLKKNKRKIYNHLIFLKYLLDDIKNDILKNHEKFFFNDADIKEFQDDIKVIICKEKCPCCNRLCGYSDNTHKAHKCLFGHQMRAIGGMKLTNDDASVCRCEDIRDTDIIKFNGNDITWLDFKKNCSTDQINSWNFDDIQQTRNDKKLKERFTIAWNIIGKKVCNEMYEGANMKYVAYNQENVDSQINKFNGIAGHYIFVIDSSG